MRDASAGNYPPPTAGETVGDALRRLSAAFRDARLPTPELDARILTLAACGLSHEDYVLRPGRRLAPEQRAILDELRERRLGREPVSRIVGRREFWGRSFRIDASTLDPRPETETLVEAVLAEVRSGSQRNDALRIIDLGTGSGSILLSVLAELPNAWGVGVDIDPAALMIAGQNARDHGLSHRVSFCCGDWAAPFAGPFDVIVSNPPYIGCSDIDRLEPEVSRHDPRRALDGGKDGMDAYRHIAGEAGAIAAPGALLALEIGSGQAPYISDLLVRTGWCKSQSQLRIVRDLAEHDRVVVVRRASVTAFGVR